MKEGIESMWCLEKERRSGSYGGKRSGRRMEKNEEAGNEKDKMRSLGGEKRRETE